MSSALPVKGLISHVDFSQGLHSCVKFWGWRKCPPTLSQVFCYCDSLSHSWAGRRGAGQGCWAVTQKCHRQATYSSCLLKDFVRFSSEIPSSQKPLLPDWIRLHPSPGGPRLEATWPRSPCLCFHISALLPPPTNFHGAIGGWKEWWTKHNQNQAPQLTEAPRDSVTLPGPHFPPTPNARPRSLDSGIPRLCDIFGSVEFFAQPWAGAGCQCRKKKGWLLPSLTLHPVTCRAVILLR